MKKEKWITIGICSIFILFAGFFYLHGSDGASRDEVKQSDWTELSGSSSPQKAVPTQKELAAEEVSHQNNSKIAVYLCGAVRHPGVYRMKPDDRICDVLQAAGGFRKKAVRDAVNLARVVKDGEQISIPFQTHQKSMKKKVSSHRYRQKASSQKSDKVNINQATQDQLMSLSGIGESKAKSIIEYRKEQGSFSSIEDIMKIPGIKEGVFRQIKDKISV
jgi:competence protein ComEA